MRFRHNFDVQRLHLVLRLGSIAISHIPDTHSFYLNHFCNRLRNSFATNSMRNEMIVSIVLSTLECSIAGWMTNSMLACDVTYLLNRDTDIAVAINS